jgi:hypothetical protein
MVQYTGFALTGTPKESSIMPRRAFLSYPCDHEEHEEIKAICGFLQVEGCIIGIPPACGWTYYSAMEAAIEQCDVFVAVMDPIVVDGSTQLFTHLHYAVGLQGMRFHPRPRIFGLWLGPPKENGFSSAWPIEPLDRSKLSLLLEDLPPRNNHKF